MALDTRAGLKEAVKTKLLRPGDTLLDPFMDDWIAICEAQFNRKNLLRAMIQVASDVSLSESSTTPGRLALPDDFKELRSIIITSPAPMSRIDPVAPEVLEQYLFDTSQPSRPKYVAIIGQEFNFAPLLDQDYTLQLSWCAKITPLSDTVTSNWLLENAPDVYLWGTLMQAAMDLEDAASNLIKWTSSYQAAVADLVAADKKATLPSSAGKLHFSGLPTLGTNGLYNINTDQ